MTAIHSRSRILMIVVAVIVAVEILVLLQLLGLGRTPLTLYDCQVYDRLAQNLLDRATFSPEANAPWSRSYFRTPGYPAFIAAVYTVCGRSLMAVRAAQFVLLGLSAWLLARIAQRLVDPSCAALAAILCVTYPSLVFISTLYLAEAPSTLAGLLAVASLLRLSQQERPKTASLVLLGLILAVLTYLRPAYIAFPFFCAVVLLLRPKRLSVGRKIARVAIVLICYGAFLAPWIARNCLLVGRPVGLSSGGNWGLFVSMRQYKGEISYGLFKWEWDAIIAEYDQRHAEAEQAARAWSGTDVAAVLARTEYLHDRSYARDAIVMLRSLSLRQLVPSGIHRLYWLWSTADFSPWAAQPAHRLFQAYHLVVCAFATLGIWLSRKRLLDHWPLWMLPVYLTLLHFVFHVEARYTVPARPFMLVYCAVGLHALWVTARRRQRRDAETHSL